MDEEGVVVVIIIICMRVVRWFLAIMHPPPSVAFACAAGLVMVVADTSHLVVALAYAWPFDSRAVMEDDVSASS